MVPSCAGVFSESQHDEDVDMEEGGAKLKHISGYSELRFRRDHMKIVPLYHPEDNTMNFDVLEELMRNSLK